MTHRLVLFNEITQKVRFTDNNFPQAKGFKELGKMTRVEYDFLISVLDERFDDKDISQMQFARYFNEVREFSNKLKRIAI